MLVGTHWLSNLAGDCFNDMLSNFLISFRQLKILWYFPVGICCTTRCLCMRCRLWLRLGLRRSRRRPGRGNEACEVV